MPSQQVLPSSRREGALQIIQTLYFSFLRKRDWCCGFHGGWKNLVELNFQCENGPPHSKMHFIGYQHMPAKALRVQELIVHSSGRGIWFSDGHVSFLLKMDQIYMSRKCPFSWCLSIDHATYIMWHSCMLGDNVGNYFVATRFYKRVQDWWLNLKNHKTKTILRTISKRARDTR